MEAQSQELIDKLSSETGVSVEDVRKILDRLGLDAAIAGVGGNVRLDDLRLAAGSAHM